ncbi:hypothetical protein D3C85_1653180 [compost metagenome]
MANHFVIFFVLYNNFLHILGPLFFNELGQPAKLLHGNQVAHTFNHVFWHLLPYSLFPAVVFILIYNANHITSRKHQPGVVHVYAHQLIGGIG